MADSRACDDRERRLRQAAEFNGRPVLTLLCMGAMMAFGVVPIVLAVRMAVSARHWVETPIEVVDAGLHRSHTGNDETVVSEARASYRYRFGASVYTGHRIGVHLDPSLRWGVLLFHACFAIAPVWPMYLAARALVARGRLRRRGIEPAP